MEQVTQPENRMISPISGNKQWQKPQLVQLDLQNTESGMNKNVEDAM